MIKQVAWTFIANFASQGLVFLALVYFASAGSAAVFGELSIALSIAAILAILITCQVERIYILLDAENLKRYMLIHLAGIILITLVCCLFSYMFLDSKAIIASATGGALAVNQIGTYFFGRIGDFRRLYGLKLGQGIITAILVAGSVFFSAERLASYGFAVGWALPSIAFMVQCVRTKPTINDLLDFASSIRANGNVLQASVISMLAVTAVREAPVLFAGYFFGVNYAGTVGLVNRMFGQPMGLLGKSISPVMNNIVGQQIICRTILKKLATLLAAALAFCLFLFAAVIGLRPFFFTDYALLNETLILLFPPIYLQFVIGVSGSLIIWLGLHSYEMKMYLGQMATFLVMLGIVVWVANINELSSFGYVNSLALYSGSCVVPAILFIRFLIRRLLIASV